MAYQHLEPFSKQLTIIVGLGVVGLMTLGLALSLYHNALFERTLLNLHAKNMELKRAIEEGHRKLEYYWSTQYKDKYAKESLGLINPGESVLIITDRLQGSMPIDREAGVSLSEQQLAGYMELLRQMPVIEHWKLYLFHPERVEELKESFGQSS